MAGRGAAPRGGGGPGTVRDCTSGLETINIQNVAARRFPVVDEEAGVVLAMAVFIRKPGTTTRRNMFGEWFFLENHKTRAIYATVRAERSNHIVANTSLGTSAPFAGHPASLSVSAFNQSP